MDPKPVPVEGERVHSAAEEARNLQKLKPSAVWRAAWRTTSTTC